MIKKYIFISIFLNACLTLAVQAEPLPQVCQQNCIANFGIPVGASPTGVKAYSNCNSDCVFRQPNFESGVYTGIKWQCVEYARRWLLVNEGVVYGDVDIAANIWDLPSVHSPDKENTYAFASIVNGSKTSDLQRGDLLIYAAAFLGTGHVAVVLQVDEATKTITVGEQNYRNEIWRSKSARAISYIIEDDALWLLDPYLIGWKRITR